VAYLADWVKAGTVPDAHAFSSLILMNFILHHAMTTRTVRELNQVVAVFAGQLSAMPNRGGDCWRDKFATKRSEVSRATTPRVMTVMRGDTPRYQVLDAN
jgi:hypothetical protein